MFENLKNIEENVPKVLEDRNLFVNKTKTEKYSISKDQNDETWKDCKLVGSKLDTVADIRNRKILANASFCKLKTIFKEKKCTKQAKLAIFSALVESIFLYNSEVWTITKGIENEIDIFQRRLLRNLMGYRYTVDRKTGPQIPNYMTIQNKYPGLRKSQNGD